MKRLISFLIIIFSITGLSSKADDIDFKVSAPSQVQLGERFRLTYQVNADVDDFSPPSFDKFQILSGPNRGQNSSIQIVNGKVTQNISISYSYIILALEEGEFTIPPAKASVKGKDVNSPAKIIRVLGSNQAANTQQRNQPKEADGLKADDVYIKASVDRKNVYLGEQVIISYRIYTKVPISNLSIDKLSSFNGFWSVDLLDNNGNLKQRREMINGEEYIVADLKKSALFPQKTGTLEIESMSLSCVAQVQTSKKKVSSNDPFFDSFFNDPFFSNNFRNVEKTLISNTINLTVKDLPSAGKPAFFSGAVGQYTLGSNIDHKEVMANEAITLKYTISGQGNVDLLPDLVVNFPADFEVYDPKITTKSRKSNNGISGYKTFEYTIIPRSAGDFEIPSVSFNFYDPKKNEYQEITSDSYQLQVSKSDQTASTNRVYSGGSQEDIKYIGQDIRYIYLMPFDLEAYEHFFFGSNWFFILLISPLIFTLLLGLLYRKEKKKRGNTSLMKNKNATKVAKKRLKKAHEFLKTQSEADFYNETGQALWGYVSDKFNIPLAELSVDTVSSRLSDKEVPQDLIDEFLDALNNCEFARFAPGDKGTMMEKVYQQGIQIISKTEDQLK